MKNKKLLAPVFLAASFMLAGCSSTNIVARPDWSSDSIITNVISKDNTMKAVYDAIKAIGSTNQDLLNDVLYKIALKTIGDYRDTDDLKGLATIAKSDFNTIKDDVKKFVEKYPIYACKQTTGVTTTSSEVTLSEDDKLMVSYRTIKKVYEDSIEEGIYQALLDEIKGGTYSFGETKDFNEEKYVWYLYKNMYLRKDNNGKYITPDDINGLLTKSSLPTLSKNLSNIHFTYRENGQPYRKYVENDYSGTIRNRGFLYVNKVLGSDGKLIDDPNHIYNSYIYGPYLENKIIPNIYRNLLIQNYVQNQRYSAIGRSYARKVNMVSVDAGTNVGAITTMFQYYAKKNLVSSSGTYGNNAFNLETLSRCLTGYYKSVSAGYDDTTYLEQDDTVHYPGLEPLKLTTDEGNSVTIKFKSSITTGPSGTNDTYNVYVGTKLADLVTKLAKIKNPDKTSGEISINSDNRKKVDADALKEFTNSNAYPVSVGLKIKENEILASHYTKDGWQLKTNMTELGDTVKDHLFNITTANNIDDGNKQKDNAYNDSNDYARYFKYQNDGNTVWKGFLTGTYDKSSGVSDEKSIVLKEGTKVSIIEVQEAVSTSKLSEVSKGNYIHLKKGANAYDSIVAMNDIIHDAAKINASGDTYKKNSEQYYLMISNIIIHDTSVYNFFKSQFPDLFK